MYVRTSQYGMSGARGLGDTLVSSLAAAIRQVEGYNPNFAPNNNPGNLIYVGPNQNGQTGVTKGAGGFAKFMSPASGESALEWQAQNYIDRGYTLTDFINTWAPPNTQNDAGGKQTQQMTTNYVASVAASTGIDPNIPLNSIQSSYSGPGSYSPSDSSSFDSSTDTSSDPLSSWLPSFGSDQTYDLAGMVLSGSDLLMLGGAIVGTVLLFSIL